MNKKAILSGIFFSLFFASIFFFAYTRLSPAQTYHCKYNHYMHLDDNLDIEDPNDFTVAVMGDCRGNTEAFEQIIWQAKKNSDFAFILGDLVHWGKPEQFDFFIRELNEEQGELPVYTVIGNHELDYKKSSDLYKKVLGATHYWLMSGKTLFVAFNNVEKSVWKDELKWLNNTLAAKSPEASLVFVLMHKQPHYEYREDHRPLSKKETRQLMKVLHRYPVDAVFASHLHSYVNYTHEGIPVYITGEAGAPQDRNPPIYGYVLLHIKNDNFSVEHIEMENVTNWDYFEYVFLVALFPVWPWASLSFFGMLCLTLYPYYPRKKRRSS